VFLCVYAASAPGRLFAPPAVGRHFVYLAHALVHGHLEVLVPLADHGDMTLVRGSWYVPFPPLPALAFVPFVALFGLNVYDHLISLTVGALNCALVWLVLRTPRLHLTGVPRAGLTVLFGLGTVHWYA